jgi:hypothetical protein
MTWKVPEVGKIVGLTVLIDDVLVEGVVWSTVRAEVVVAGGVRVRVDAVPVEGVGGSPGRAEVVAGNVGVEGEPPTHELLPQDCPGLQALHSDPTLQTFPGKLQQTASDV